MKLPVEQVDLSIRDQLDAESLVSFYLNRDMYLEGRPKPSIQPEIGLDTDALAMNGVVIVYDVGEPYQFTSPKAWLWRFPVTFTVLSIDADLLFRTCARLNRNIAMWRWLDGCEYGKIGGIPTNNGFRHDPLGEITNSKVINVMHADKVIQAASPR